MGTDTLTSFCDNKKNRICTKGTDFKKKGKTKITFCL